MKRLSISRLSEFCEESINQSVNPINQSIILLVETNRRPVAAWLWLLLCWCRAPHLDFILTTLTFQFQFWFEWLS
jgi:hypothetical protein